MTQTRVRLTDRFKAFQLENDGKFRGNLFDQHPGEWVVSDDRANYVGIFPTVEEARTWAEAQLSRIEQVAATYLLTSHGQDPDDVSYAELVAMWRGTQESQRALALRRVGPLIDAWNYTPMTPEYRGVH
jgi:hypothetical protein